MMNNEVSGMRVFACLGLMAAPMLGLARADELVDYAIRVGGKDPVKIANLMACGALWHQGGRR